MPARDHLTPQGRHKPTLDRAVPETRPDGTVQAWCDGYPPNHPAGECPWCDEVNSTLHIINGHREREGLPLIRSDDPQLQTIIERGGYR